MYYTYKITNNITGEYYIGSHRSDDFLNDDYYGSGKKIKESVKKYGKENHTKEILGTFDTMKESMEYEHSLVKQKRQIEKDPLILNMNNGGGFEIDYCTHEERVAQGKLASHEYATNQKNHNMEEYYKNPKVCKVCGKVIPYEKRFNNNYFCSSSCAATYNNKSYNYPKREPEGMCVVCGKQISTRYKFCSDECKNKYMEWKHNLYPIAKKVNNKQKEELERDSNYIKNIFPYSMYLEHHKNEIMENRANGMTYRELGKKYGCSHDYIGKFISKWQNEHLIGDN